MSGDSLVAGSFVVADYVMFALMLVVSSAVGFYYAWVSRGQQSSQDFLTGGRRLTALPVAMSLTASFQSSIALLSNPAEVYFFGAIFVFFSLNYMVAVVVSEVFLPVYYRLGITSTYEYLELRFNRATRLLGTVLFIVQTILYTGIVIYGPALALNQVTGLDLWGGIISTGIVCTLYCTLGGLKAVVWTDVFQVSFWVEKTHKEKFLWPKSLTVKIGIMLAGYLSVVIKSVILQEGVHTIISDSRQGGRLNFVDFDINPFRRHTFWTTFIGGGVGWTAIYATNQAQVQRYISCKSVTHARVAVYISMFGMSVFLVCSVFAGLCLYSVYKNCDPWTAGLISAPDQLIPFLVMDILTGYPGLPGLFFAAIHSGSLSTVSTSINALAAVTLEDLIKPYTNMSEKHLYWMSKGLSVLYGALCISIAGLASVLGGMMQAGVMVGSVTSGPLLGLFTLGILCPFANSKGGLSALVSGLIATLCVTIGSVIYPPSPAMTRPLSLSTEGCNFTTTGGLNWSSTVLPTEPSFTTTAPVQNSDNEHLLESTWQSPSYLYICLIGTVIAIIVGLIVSLLTGGLRTRVESRLTLMKEDTTSYHVFMWFKDRVMRKAGKHDLKKNGEKKVGKTNPAFCDPTISE